MQGYCFLFAAALAATSTATTTAQQASYTWFGTPGKVGCSPYSAEVTHGVANLPRIGSTFVAVVPNSGTMCNYHCNLRLFATGLSNTYFNGVALPAATNSLLQSCGKLRISLDSIALMPVGGLGTSTTYPLVIPNNPNLVGMSFYQQSISLTYTLGGLNTVAWGRAGHGTVGY